MIEDNCFAEKCASSVKKGDVDKTFRHGPGYLQVVQQRWGVAHSCLPTLGITLAAAVGFVPTPPQRLEPGDLSFPPNCLSQEGVPQFPECKRTLNTHCSLKKRKVDAACTMMIKRTVIYRIGVSISRQKN